MPDFLAFSALDAAITTHGPGEFTGEASMISGQRSLVLGRVTDAGQFLEMNAEALRSLIGPRRRIE